MRQSYLQLYVHFVWGTYRRRPLIKPAFEPQLYEVMKAICEERQCVPLAIGGIADHVHLLVRLAATIAVDDLIANVKGTSSYLTRTAIAPQHFFKWQRGYGAFTVRQTDVPRLRDYIRNQKRHHARKTINEVWEL